jgi:sigma-54 dependent transcriptional regulator, flagellar regulatory protein
MKVIEKMPATRSQVTGLIGDSGVMATLRAIIARVGASSAPVLLQGPSGSGKEVAARAIHLASDRRNKPFIAINCGAIPTELIESELFGHEKGAFTGALARRIGRFEEADGGTLFLDEIGDMRVDMQVKLLRVLEQGQVTRVGGSGETGVDVRIISATHQCLYDAIRSGRFRQDLYFRLGVLPVQLPALVERRDDIPALLRHFDALSRRHDNARFDASGIAMLQRYDWPGNVRELRNIYERAAALYPGETIDARRASALLGKAAPLREVTIGPSVQQSLMPSMSLPATLDASPAAEGGLAAGRMELANLCAALDTAEAVIADAAQMLAMKRSMLVEKMQQSGF